MKTNIELQSTLFLHSLGYDGERVAEIQTIGTMHFVSIGHTDLDGRLGQCSLICFRNLQQAYDYVMLKGVDDTDWVYEADGVSPSGYTI